MTGALRLLLLCCLLPGGTSQNWAVSMPTSMEALAGSCVTVPCSFRVERRYKASEACKAVWRKGDKDGETAFNSSAPDGRQAFGWLRGRLTGSLHLQNCTTTLMELQPQHTNTYFMRVECPGSLKYTFAEKNLSLTVKDLPPTPVIVLSPSPLKERTPAMLECLAPAPCPSQPPTLTWSLDLGGQVSPTETLYIKDGTQKVRSNLTFTASHRHHGNSISCTAVYRPSSNRSYSVQLRVLHSPKNTTVSGSRSGSIAEGNLLNLTCTSDANPPVNTFTWFRVTEHVVVPVGKGASVSVTPSEVNKFYCEAKNEYGTENSGFFKIDMQFPPKDTVVAVAPPGAVLQGGSATLTCHSNANPAVENYTWYRVNPVGVVKVNSGHNFTVNGIAVGDDSKYYCEARNTLGMDRSPQITIQVLSVCSGQRLLIFLVATTAVLAVALFCAVLQVVRAQKKLEDASKRLCHIGDPLANQAAQASNRPEEPLYANSQELMGAAELRERSSPRASSPTRPPEASPRRPAPSPVSSSGDVSYTQVKKKHRGQREDANASSYLEEERCILGIEGRHRLSKILQMDSLYNRLGPKNDAEKPEECEYAQVKFKTKVTADK